MRFCSVETESLGDRLCKWARPEVTWTFAGELAGFTRAEVLAAAEEAWGYWADICGLKPQYLEDARLANVVMTVGKIDRSGATLAYSEMPCGGQRQLQQKYDSSERWIIAEDPPPGKIDLTRVMAHEIGHALGLPHEETGAIALMDPTYSASIRRPQKADIEEAQRRYGPPTGAPQPTPSPEPTPHPKPGGSMDWLKKIGAIAGAVATIAAGVVSLTQGQFSEGMGLVVAGVTALLTALRASSLEAQIQMLRLGQSYRG